VIHLKHWLLLSGTIFLLSGCPPFGNGNGDQPNPILPWPPPVYGNAGCGTILTGANPSCQDFAALKQCLKIGCELGCRGGSCVAVYYDNGCPSTKSKADAEPCIAGIACGQPRRGEFPIGQFFCNKIDPITGKNPLEVERERCKVADVPVDPDELEVADDNANRGLVQSRATSLLPGLSDDGFDSVLQSYIEIPGPDEDSCPLPTPDPTASPTPSFTPSPTPSVTPSPSVSPTPTTTPQS